MAAYPLLFVLPFRFPHGIPDQESQAVIVSGGTSPSADQDELLNALLELAGQSNPRLVYRSLAAAISRELPADIALLISTRERDGNLEIFSAVDLLKGRDLPFRALPAASLPQLLQSLNAGRAFSLPEDGEHPEQINLGRLIQKPSCGPLLAAPLLDPQEMPFAGVILLSPYGEYAWQPADETRLLELAPRLARVLSCALHIQNLQERLAQVLESSAAANHLNDELLAQLDSLQQKAAQEQARAEGLAALITVQEAEHQAQNATDNVLGWYELSEDDLRSGQTSQDSSEFDVEDADELRIALEEKADWQVELAASLSDVTSSDELASPSTAANLDSDQPLLSLSQELRQPVSSILGYADVLLTESVGIISSRQRKLIERIKTSSERLETLVTDLLRQTGGGDDADSLAIEPLSLVGVVEEATSLATLALKKKKVSLHLEIPPELPNIMADRAALLRVLLHLLQNAAAASPRSGQVTLAVQTGVDNGNIDNVLLQISDQGPGIPAAQLSRLFSPGQSSQEKQAGASFDLPALKVTVEDMGGRIWVDSEVDQGSTFNLLLTLASPELFDFDEYADDRET
jgi:signal transduction histidine kinase